MNDLPETYRQLEQDLRSQYLLSYHDREHEEGPGVSHYRSESGPSRCESPHDSRLSALAVALARCRVAADLRPSKEPAKIATVFPAGAKVRAAERLGDVVRALRAGDAGPAAIDETFGAELALVGVSLDDMMPDAKPEKVRQFLDRQRSPSPTSTYNGNADDLGEHLKFDGEIPITIVFDRKGQRAVAPPGAPRSGRKPSRGCATILRRMR